MSAQPPVLQVTGLNKAFGRDPSQGLQNIDLTLQAGETLALVGRSGSGKTTLARLIMCLNAPDSGQIFLNGIDLGTCNGKALRALRAKFQMVFQDPLAAFNPRRRISEILQIPLQLHDNRKNPADKIAEILERVGLSADMAQRFPRELSGGQRQRVAIARALLSKPDLIVLDEPVSALDVSVRAKILNLLKNIQQETGVAYLFISHDLAIVKAFCDQMLVLDDGQIVERGIPSEILENPQASATRQLVDAVPRLKFQANGLRAE